MTTTKIIIINFESTCAPPSPSADSSRQAARLGGTQTPFGDYHQNTFKNKNKPWVRPPVPPWASAAYVEAVGPLRRRTHNRALQRRADLLIGVRSTITRHNHCFQGCHNHNHDFNCPYHNSDE